MVELEGNIESTSASAESYSELRAIGSVAREVGLTPRAIRYYEKLGLLQPAVRVKGSDRLFDDSDVERLRDIKQLREVIGFSLAEISQLLETDDARGKLRSRFRSATDPQVRKELLRQGIALAERRLTIAERKLAQVEAIRLDDCARLARLRALLAEEEK
ncbi:MAG: MerR family transcriptional regulator [Bacteroidetes bacterium]|nr:MerR family transcriptional regulator [Bacteroidota bacterium]